MTYRSKYHSKKITRDGITYDSIKEYRRHTELLLLERAGAIQELKRQVKFELLPAQYEEGNGKKRGKCLERAVHYVADFVYIENGETVVEDTKGCRVGITYNYFVLKRKLMLWVHGINIKEV